MSTRWNLADVEKKSPAIQAQVRAELWRTKKPNHVVPIPTHNPAPASVVEHRHENEPLADDRAQAGHSGKHIVRVTSYRVRLLDEDNLCEKFHIDALRYSGILPSDAPDRTRIITSQEKVRTKAEQRTEISIELIP
tara:strand:- start:1510 stop:1917 length:408 start_codon:yes stop_codon:yes gene_type:complete